MNNGIRANERKKLEYIAHKPTNNRYGAQIWNSQSKWMKRKSIFFSLFFHLDLDLQVLSSLLLVVCCIHITHTYVTSMTWIWMHTFSSESAATAANDFHYFVVAHKTLECNYQSQNATHTHHTKRKMCAKQREETSYLVFCKTHVEWMVDPIWSLSCGIFSLSPARSSSSSTPSDTMAALAQHRTEISRYSSLRQQMKTLSNCTGNGKHFFLTEKSRREKKRKNCRNMHLHTHRRRFVTCDVISFRSLSLRRRFIYFHRVSSQPRPLSLLHSIWSTVRFIVFVGWWHGDDAEDGGYTVARLDVCHRTFSWLCLSLSWRNKFIW